MIKKIRCPNCHSTNISKRHGFLFCESCRQKYFINKGIIFFIPEGKIKLSGAVATWDFIYEEGIKGDFTRGEDNLVKALERSLKEEDELLNQYPLIFLAKKYGIKKVDVLEIGCGTGAFGLLIKKLGIAKNIFLLDFSLPALKTAQKIFRRFGEEGHFILADAKSLPFKNESFNLVFSTGLIEHFDRENQAQVVLEHARVSSRVLLQFPKNSFAYWLQRIFVTILNVGSWPFGYERPLTSNKVKKLLNENKFIGSSYHDLLSGVIYKLSLKFAFIKPLKHKSFLNKILSTDDILFFSKDD